LEDLSAKLARLLDKLETGLVERRREMHLALLAALAGEHTLLIGPPGTAKSELARRLHHAFRDARYFERLLTRFSVPEELFGPLSISALEQDRYERHTAGFLPDASIAFIDEVFRANSAILNALLTLLNEREFDNGAGRMRCPLISVIGATNEVPDDEVAEAFFDRFLMRLRVSPVSAGGYRQLLGLSSGVNAIDSDDALDVCELAALARSAASVQLPDGVADLLIELRSWLEGMEQRIFVSDRRWVKIVRLMKIACASEGRGAISDWDLWLLPWCVAAEPSGQDMVSEWLASRLGVRVAFSPPRLTRVVEAFEAQLAVEREANDLDYDESGRLRFSADNLSDSVGDAKGGAQALRMSYARKRRYGQSHVSARTAQIDALLGRIDAYKAELVQRREDLAAYVAGSVWMDEVVAARVDANLVGTGAAIDSLRARALAARAGFHALPRLAEDPGVVPAPVVHDPLSA
jgi:MoxR-like ATPase